MVFLQVLDNLSSYFQPLRVENLVGDFSKLINMLLITQHLAQDIRCYLIEWLL